MDTHDRLGGTRDPLRESMRTLSSIGLFSHPKFLRFEDGDVTFTQAEVDEKVTSAVTAEKAKHGKSWYDNISEEHRSSPTIQKYKDGSFDDVVKGHIELEKRIGLKGVLVPSEGSSDQVKSDFYKAVGRPDSADLYTSPSRDGLHKSLKEANETDTKWFNELAFTAGLSIKQKDIIHAAYLTQQSQRLTDYDKLEEEERNTAATELRNKLGASYEEKLALANGLVKKFGSEDLMGKIGSDPEIIEFLINIGSQLSEDKLGELGRSGMGMTPEQAKVEISKITKQIMDTDQNDPIYKDMLTKKNNLYKIAYPTPGK